MDINYEKKYSEIRNQIYEVLRKKGNYSNQDLEYVMQKKYNAKKIKLEEINVIMKKKYKLYHKNANTPLIVSDETISNDSYVGTYVIYTNIDDKPTKKDSVYLHTAYIIGSKNGINPDSFQIFNGTKEITTYLEILCNHSIEDILSRNR